ncbi:MAG: EamA family transporter [Faecousia sp.]
MNWFWFSIIALLCWSGSDLFSKIGCCGEKDKTAHLKMVVAVGVVMGLHAAYMVFFNDVIITWEIIWRYLPVSLLYILSMTLGYVGLRYIELSVSSPICNSSGALVAVLSICLFGISSLEANPVLVLGAVALVCVGVIGLGVVEAREDEELRARRQEHANRKYAKSWLALCLPIAYCLLDAAGTFADAIVLETLNEDSANVAYELTFLIAGIGCLVYLLIRREKFFVRQEAPKYIGACFETVGQLFYIYALADEEHVMFSAPIISAYCVASVLWSRLFLREKLSWKHYSMIALVVVGIVILGVFDI